MQQKDANFCLLLSFSYKPIIKKCGRVETKHVDTRNTYRNAYKMAARDGSFWKLYPLKAGERTEGPLFDTQP